MIVRASVYVAVSICPPLSYCRTVAKNKQEPRRVELLPACRSKNNMTNTKRGVAVGLAWQLLAAMGLK